MADWTLLSASRPKDGAFVRVHPADAPNGTWTVATFVELADNGYRFEFVGNATPQEIDAWKPKPAN